MGLIVGESTDKRASKDESRLLSITPQSRCSAASEEEGDEEEKWRNKREVKHEAGKSEVHLCCISLWQFYQASLD